MERRNLREGKLKLRMKRERKVRPKKSETPRRVRWRKEESVEQEECEASKSERKKKEKRGKPEAGKNEEKAWKYELREKSYKGS